LAGNADCENCGTLLYNGIATGAKLFVTDIGKKDVLNDISGDFEVELGGDIYGDTTGPYAGEYEWDGDTCYVDVVDWPAELDSAPENIKNTVLEIVKNYVDENNEEWSIYGNSWN
jgi:hypothetical protein